MTRERKILATILTVGVGALLVDRALQSGEPVAADAAVFVAPASAATDGAALTPPAAAPVAAALPQGPSVAQRLARTAERLAIDPAQVQEAFSPPASWLPQTVAGAEGPAEQPLSAQARQFAQRHRLEAVVLSGDASFVVIDGMTLRRGQPLDGLLLVEIQSRAAVFESAQMRVVLRLSDAGDGGEGR